MASLKHSRGKFFHTHRMPEGLDFVRYLAERFGWDPERFAEEYPTRVPRQSNSEDLEKVVETLAGRLPDSWKPHLQSIFVGRILTGETNATAWSAKQSGIVEISIQFTLVLGSYVAVLDEFRTALHTYVQGPPDDPDAEKAVLRDLNARLRVPWEKLSERRASWANPQLLAHGLIDLPFETPSERAAYRNGLVGLCEMFIVAHEVAHHLLGHTRRGHRDDEAHAIVHDAITRAGIWDLLQPLNASQRTEAQADVLAFLMVSDAVGRQPAALHLNLAVQSSLVVLLALAHIADTWNAADSTDSHPGFVTRWDYVAALAESLAQDREVERGMEHPLVLLAEMAVLAGYALSLFMDRRNRPSISIGAAAHVYWDLLRQIEPKIPKQ